MNEEDSRAGAETQKAMRCTCPPGFYDAACPVHRYECDRQQLEQDLRRIPRRNRQTLVDDENQIPRRGVR